jgi:hypothetical protein
VAVPWNPNAAVHEHQTIDNQDNPLWPAAFHLIPRCADCITRRTWSNWQIRLRYRWPSSPDSRFVRRRLRAAWLCPAALFKRRCQGDIKGDFSGAFLKSSLAGERREVRRVGQPTPLRLPLGETGKGGNQGVESLCPFPCPKRCQRRPFYAV